MNSSSSDTDDSLDDFQLDEKDKQKAKKRKIVKKPKKKALKPFQPVIKKTKTKQSGDNYRRRKNKLIEHTYKLINEHEISVALVLTGQQFTKGIEVAGAGFTLDELSPNVLHFTNYVAENSNGNESVQELLKAAKKRVFRNAPVSINNLEDVDDFIKDAVAKVLGVEPKKRAEEAIVGGVLQDVAGPSQDQPPGQRVGPAGDEAGPSQEQSAQMEASPKTKRRVKKFTKKLYKFCQDMNSSATAIIGWDGSSSIGVCGAGFTLGCIARKKQIHNVTYYAPITHKKYAPGLEVMKALKMSESIEPTVVKASKKKKQGEAEVPIEEDIQIVGERVVSGKENVTFGLEKKKNKLRLNKPKGKKDAFEKKLPPAGTIKRKNIFNKEDTESSPFAI